MLEIQTHNNLGKGFQQRNLFPCDRETCFLVTEIPEKETLLKKKNHHSLFNNFIKSF